MNSWWDDIWLAWQRNRTANQSRAYHWISLRFSSARFSSSTCIVLHRHCIRCETVSVRSHAEGWRRSRYRAELTQTTRLSHGKATIDPPPPRKLKPLKIDTNTKLSTSNNVSNCICHAKIGSNRLGGEWVSIKPFSFFLARFLSRHDAPSKRFDRFPSFMLQTMRHANRRYFMSLNSSKITWRVQNLQTPYL